MNSLKIRLYVINKNYLMWKNCSWHRKFVLFYDSQTMHMAVLDFPLCMNTTCELKIIKNSFHYTFSGQGCNNVVFSLEASVETRFLFKIQMNMNMSQFLWLITASYQLLPPLQRTFFSECFIYFMLLVLIFEVQLFCSLGSAMNFSWCHSP